MKCGKTVVARRSCRNSSNSWDLCYTCHLTCSHCGEQDIRKFTGYYEQQCVNCKSVISCKNCIINNKNWCKDCQNL